MIVDFSGKPTIVNRKIRKTKKKLTIKQFKIKSYWDRVTDDMIKRISKV